MPPVPVSASMAFVTRLFSTWWISPSKHRTGYNVRSRYFIKQIPIHKSKGAER